MKTKERGIIKLGIIGCGRVASERHFPALNHIPDIRVVATADTNKDRMGRLADRFGIQHRFMDYHALLERRDVDAVAVFTPTSSHAEIGLAALDAEKHVLIEKPLALNLDECDRLIARGGHSTSKVVVGFNLRWHRLLIRARRFIQSGALGSIKAIRSVYTHYRHGEDAPAWHRKIAVGGGVAFNEAVHHFDLWRYLLQTEVDEIFSFSCPSDYYEDETRVTTARLSNGALATAVFTLKTSPNNELEIYGETGRLYISCYRFDGWEFFPHTGYPGDLWNRLKKTILGIKGMRETIAVQRLGGDFSASFVGLWRHFAACVRKDETPGSMLSDGKNALRIALAAIESASSGKPVKVKRA